MTEARGEITAGLVLALLGWLYSRYRMLMRNYRRKKQELERIENEMFRLGATKQEIERLQAELKESEAQRQDLQTQLEELQQGLKLIRAELQRKEEALEKAEAQKAEEAKRMAEIERQLEQAKAEIQRKDEALREAEAKKLEALQRVAEVQATVNDEHLKTPKTDTTQDFVTNIINGFQVVKLTEQHRLCNLASRLNATIPMTGSRIRPIVLSAINNSIVHGKFSSESSKSEYQEKCALFYALATISEYNEMMEEFQKSPQPATMMKLVATVRENWVNQHPDKDIWFRSTVDSGLKIIQNSAEKYLPFLPQKLEFVFSKEFITQLTFGANMKLE